MDNSLELFLTQLPNPVEMNFRARLSSITVIRTLRLQILNL